MPYSRTTWVDNSAPDLDAANLNNMESGIAAAPYGPDASAGWFPVGNGSGGWVYRALQATDIPSNLQASKLSGYPSDASKVLHGDGSWAGPVKNATTVAGLGTADDGTHGRLRLGTTPYDFLDLVYDATYGHWVSSEILVASVYTFTTTSTGLTSWPGSSPDRLLQLKLPVAAGLTLQGRLVCGISNTAGGANTVITDMFTQTVDVGGSFNATTTQGGSFSQSQTGSTTKLVDSGWNNLAVDLTTHDYVLVEPVVKTGGAGTAQVLIGHVLARWIG